jgi:hypothetical protein
MLFSQLVVVPLWMFGATTASWFLVKYTTPVFGGVPALSVPPP